MADHFSDFIRELVRRRASQRCEYCLIHEYTQAAAFHIDHCIPINKGGAAEVNNLALACPHCDRQKWDSTHGRDLISNQNAPIFRPRIESWNNHFCFEGFVVVGISPTGRVTVELLKLNHPPKVRIRQIEETLGLFPPISENL